jgi:hypothetical protein
VANAIVDALVPLSWGGAINVAIERGYLAAPKQCFDRSLGLDAIRTLFEIGDRVRDKLAVTCADLKQWHENHICWLSRRTNRCAPSSLASISEHQRSKTF